MMRIKTLQGIIWTLVGLVLLGVCIGLALFAPARAQENLILCASPGITDGDTFRCDGSLKIRLWGVDAPERATSAGPAATRALADITHGKTLVCRRRGKSYDRFVAQCWIGNTDVAAEMVRRGQAVDMPKFSRGHYSKHPSRPKEPTQ